MAPSLEAYANNPENKITLVKVNLDKHRELAKQFGVKTIPAFFLYDADGKQTLSGKEARDWVKTKIP